MVKKKIGHPSKFESMKEILMKLAERGFTDVQMAEIIGVTDRTINNWKKKDPVFFQSLKDWKLVADEKVERSLYERATGYSHEEDKIFNNDGFPMIVPTIKRYAPDPTSMIFWLKNRKQKEWREKQEIVATNINHNLNDDVSGMTEAELDEIIKKLKK